MTNNDNKESRLVNGLTNSDVSPDKKLSMNEKPGIRVLLIDDEETLVEYLSKRLLREGFMVKVTFSGEEAAEVAAHEDFDVAVVDLKMPGIDGVETQQKLKKIQPFLQSIVLTGHGAIDTALESGRQGAFKYLIKPTEYDNLVESIRDAYEKKIKLQQAKVLKDATFFANIFIDSPIGIYIVQDGKFVFMNPEFLRIGGFDEQDLLGMDSLGIVLPEDREKVRRSAVEMLKGESHSPYEHRVLAKDGEVRWIIETVTSIQFKGKRSVLGYFMDHTEHERAKEALNLSEDKFRKAFRSSPDWFVISTLEGGFYVDVNETFLRATGYTKDEVLGRTSSELGIWADPNKRTEMVKTLREKGVVRNLEVEFRMKSGEIRNMLWSAEVIDYGDEKCLIAVTRDITARHRAQQERLKREKLQGVVETAAAACHEINQPLQYIFLLLSEVLEKYPEDETLKEIKRQYDRIRGLTTKFENITVYQTTDYIKGEKMIDINKASKER
jgi:PAS domain S-box-containing protein